jgi:hypothetical protein
MGSVTEIWSARNLKRGLRRHWVHLREEILISGGRPDQSGVLSICQPTAGGPLVASLRVAVGRFTEEIGRGGQLFIDIRDLRLVVVVRAVEGTRVLLEFGMPRGNAATIALGA